jgi:tRNA modification GTPase
VSRARARAQDADLVLWLVPPGGEVSASPPARRLLKVGTKADVDRVRPGCDLMIAAATGDGLPELIARLEAEAASLMGHGDAVITRERHRKALDRAQGCLVRAQDLLAIRGPLELAAEEVRLSARAIGEITGRVDVEDVLDWLFSSFCIGK